ncbi:hypothetical protein IFR05_001477 [Cadophora sp. M221]|nr:hypothetical protein IFR05_001477 [Cadophora sp. M221]
MSFNVAPINIPPKGPAAPAVVMDVSPGKCTNTCPKQNCAIHAAKVDSKELADIMGRLSLSDITTNNNNKPRSGPLPGLGVTIPRPMSGPLIRKAKVKFHFVRHAQSDLSLSSDFEAITPSSLFAVHNIRTIKDNTTFRDTDLTPHGREQARELGLYFPFVDSIKALFASPLRRCVSTSLIAFPSIYERGVRVTLWEDLREFGYAQCNTGSTLHKLRENFREIKTGVVNTELLYGGWEFLYEPTVEDRMERVEKVKRELKEFEHVILNGGTWKGMVYLPHYGEEDVGVLIVSHGGFLAKLMNYPKQNWSNAEYRTFKFPSEEKIAAGCPPLHLLQTKASYAKEHVPLKQAGPPFHFEIDNTTQERLLEIQEYKDHIENCDRKAREGEARSFAAFMKSVVADEDARD